ncbi:hypothetical protein EI427_19460 [Flammeovirga pectinis]|uniref:Uncharacterized protein n=1 Tax=Flammeovirga pectinis TaxID=2494373 RepID=A0A3S9P7X6_9BACT|nr:hypothetical protein [Flammeovirga pectinis]AZQ64309.1 hypothetical protein EI427_19460 [Flammeovirga pectinis]
MENVTEKEFLIQEALKGGTPSNLIGTTWLVSPVNNDFCPFEINFDANNICKVITVNKFFSGAGNYYGNETSAVFHFTYYSNGSTYMCSSNPSEGTGTVHAQHNGHTYLMPFKMNIK